MDIIEKNSQTNNIKLLIEKDQNSAYMQIDIENSIINAKEICDLIKESGIKYGFKQAQKQNEELGTILKRKESFLFAIGETEKETKVEFNLMFDKDNAFNPDTFNGDFTELKGFDRIIEETPLADLFITQNGNSGTDIYGNKINMGNDPETILNKYIGENVSYSKDRSQIIADVAGYPYLSEDGKINVKSTFSIEKDLDSSVENFEIYGNLNVRGNIKDKIKITIYGNLEVNGDINDAEIDVSGSVKINGDILNCPNTGITANGNIYFESAENARIITSKKITFNKNALFCRLIAENGIYGEDENSSIVGGLIQSGNNIEVAIIGNSSQIGTEVEITISPFTKEKMLLLTKKIMYLRQHSPSKKSIIEKLENELQTLENKLEISINKVLLSQDELPKHIVGFKKIFAGTYIRILKKSKTIIENQNKVTFTISKGKLICDNFDN